MGYLKSRMDYENDYDRETIRQLKKIRIAEQEQLRSLNDDEGKSQLKITQAIDLQSFRNTGIQRAKNRESAITQCQESDRRRDWLVSQNPEPSGIKCNACNSRMQLSIHFFDFRKVPILFVFECQKGHLPKKVIYPTGEEFILPKRKCDSCGQEIKDKIEKTKDIMVCTETCTGCGKVTILDFDLSSPSDELISDQDRKEYCTDFIGQRTFSEEIRALAELGGKLEKGIEQRELMEEHQVEKIDKLNIPQLEKHLIKVAEENSFIKLQLEKPEMSRHVIVPFNIQDNSIRNENESLRIFTFEVEKSLFHTNWRLMNGTNYRLGYITGKLKAYENDDLIKIAKQISAKSKK